MSTNKSKKNKTKHNNNYKKASKHIKNKDSKKNKKTKKGGDSILDTAMKSFFDNIFFYITFIIGFFTIIGIIWYYIKSTTEKIVKNTTDTIANAPEKIAEVASAAATKTAEVAEVVVEEVKPENPINKTLISFGKDTDALKELVDDENESFLNATFTQLLEWVGYTKEDLKKQIKEAENNQAADEYFQKVADGSSSIDSKFSSVESNNNELPTFKPTNIQDGESIQSSSKLSFTKPDNESISTNSRYSNIGPKFLYYRIIIY